MDALLRDLRYALRTLGRSSGFAAAAILTLALGIGANTAIFSVVHGVLLSPLPYPEPDRLVRLFQAYPERGEDQGSISQLDAEDWAAANQSLVGLGLYSTLPNGLTDTGGSEPREVETAYVDGGFFSTLGTPPRLGRALGPADQHQAARVVVLSHAYWQRRFDGDPRIVGQTATLSGQPFTVAGVMPPDFRFPTPEVEAWAVLSLIPETSIPRHRFVRWLGAVGRLGPGVSVDRARVDLSSVARGLAEAHPDSNENATAVSVAPLQAHLVGPIRSALWLLAAAVGLVLLVACANVAHLTLARSIARRREVAVRSALGAGRGRLIRQMLTESLVLSLAGGAVGLLMAVWGVEALTALSGGAVPRAEEIAVDGPIFGFTLGVVILAALLFGLVPAWRATRPGLTEDLKGGGRGTGKGRSRSRLRYTLVVSEVALALLLLVGSGLLIRSFANLLATDPGFDPENLLAIHLTLSTQKYDGSEEYLPVYRDMLEGLQRLPGVTSAATMKTLPFAGSPEQYFVNRNDGRKLDQDVEAELTMISPGLFRTLRVPLLAGRSFTDRDRADAPWVVVVNETLARRLFADESLPEIVGNQIVLADQPVELVGVVGDVRSRSPGTPAAPAIYVPQEQMSRVVLTFLLRTEGDPLTTVTAARQVIRRVEPDQPIDRIIAVDELVAESVSRPRFLTTLLSLFAGLALALSAVGIGGVISHSVRQRLHEVGVRLALGAHAGDVLRLVLGQGMRPVLWGLALGLPAALAGARVLESELFELSSVDPWTYAAATTLLALVALAACWLPARRALRVDPADALRNE